MTMSLRSLFSILVLISTALADGNLVADNDAWRECVDNFDIFLVQDVSETFLSDLKSAVQLMSGWVDGVHARYPQSRFGYATFTDKPLPTSGFGPYGGWQNHPMTYDWCYDMEQALVNEKSVFVDALKRVWQKTGSGFDYPESQFEAILRAAVAQDVGWDSGLGTKRISTLVIITDAASHLPGDAAANIDVYNAPLRLSSAARMETSGGWGSHTLGDNDVICFYDQKEYKDMASLIARDTWGVLPKHKLNDEDRKRMEELKVYFGPEVYPEVS